MRRSKVFNAEEQGLIDERAWSSGEKTMLLRGLGLVMLLHSHFEGGSGKVLGVAEVGIGEALPAIANIDRGLDRWR